MIEFKKVIIKVLYGYNNNNNNANYTAAFPQSGSSSTGIQVISATDKRQVTNTVGRGEGGIWILEFVLPTL